MSRWSSACSRERSLTTAVREHRAAGFIYRNADEGTPDDVALARWATEIVPAVREAITR
jgi:hypothetical protein